MANREFQTIQTSSWDIELKNGNPDDPLYIEIFKCSECGQGLPYPKADHPCITDENVDEGFEEEWNYYNSFKRFCLEVQGEPDIRLVLLCASCGSLHYVHPVFNDRRQQPF